MQPSPSSHKVPERSLRGLDLDLTRWNVTVTILLKAGFLSEENQSLLSCPDLWMGVSLARSRLGTLSEE